MKKQLISLILILFIPVCLAETINDSDYQVNIQVANGAGNMSDSSYDLQIMSNNIAGVAQDTAYEVCIGINCQVYPRPNATSEEVIIIPVEEGGGGGGGASICEYGYHLASVGSSQYCTNCIGDLYEKESKVVCTSCLDGFTFSDVAKQCVQTRNLNYYVKYIGSRIYEKNYIAGFIIFSSFIILFLLIVLIYTPIGKKIRGAEEHNETGGAENGV